MMRKKICGLTILGFLLLLSCKTAKTKRSVHQKPLVYTIQDSSHLSFYKGDIVAYVNYVVRNQSKYVGKPLSELLKDLEIPIHSFSYSPPHNRYRITNLILGTKPYGPRNIYGEDQDFEIGIGWETFVPPDSIRSIVTANGPPDYYRWSEKAKAYFGKQIIGNLWSIYMKR